MDRFLPPVLALLAVFALLVLVAVDAEDGWDEWDVTSRLGAHSDLEDETGTKRLLHEFRHDPEHVQFFAELKLHRGSLRLCVRRPDGSVAWEHTFSSRGHDRITENFAGVNGEWQIEVELQDATGSYDVRLESSRPRGGSKNSK